MNIYAIGDLHLSLNSSKPMDVFGENWLEHHLTIKDNWVKEITDNDIVLILGDTSWAMRLEEARKDLDYIRELPGKKIFIRGNHDYWWSSINKLNALYPEFTFLQNNCYIIGNIGICGCKGYKCPGEDDFTEEDNKLYLRELNRLELSLKSLPPNITEIIVMLHYPPTNNMKEESGFTKIIEKYSVSKVVYGHLHGELYYSTSYQGLVNGVYYYLVSSDYLNFKPLKIINM